MTAKSIFIRNRLNFVKLALIFNFLLTAIFYLKMSLDSEVFYFSIYQNIPYILWVILVANIIIGTVSILEFFKKDSPWILLFAGFGIIILSNLYIIFLHVALGYIYPNIGDHLTHIGHIKQIFETGYFDNKLAYPIIHIFANNSAKITGIKIDAITNYIGPLFYLFGIIYAYLLCSQLAIKKAAVLAALAATPLFCYYYMQIFPLGQAYITFSLILYLYFKSKNKQNPMIKFLLLITSIPMIYFHPVSAAMLILSLVFAELGFYMHNKFTSKSKSFNLSFILPLILIMLLFMWIWHKYWIWNHSVHIFATWFEGELLTDSMLNTAESSFKMLNFTLVDIIVLFVKKYGHVFMYFSLSVMASIFIVINQKQIIETLDGKKFNIYSYFTLFYPIIFIWLSDYVRPLTNLSSGRMIWIVIPLFMPLIGIMLSSLVDNFKWKKNVSIIVIGIITFASTIGFISVYTDPMTHRTDTQLDVLEYTSSKWLIQNGNPEINITGLVVPLPHRIAKATNRFDYKKYPEFEKSVPNHFGYDNNTTIGKTLRSNYYLYIRQDHILWLNNNLFPELYKYDFNDFSKLETDTYANLVYGNGDLKVYQIRSYQRG